MELGVKVGIRRPLLSHVSGANLVDGVGEVTQYFRWPTCTAVDGGSAFSQEERLGEKGSEMHRSTHTKKGNVFFPLSSSHSISELRFLPLRSSFSNFLFQP